MALDLHLDSAHDIYLENYDLALRAGLEIVKQRLVVNLKLFRGEWYLDEEAGVPYYVDVFTSKPKLSLVEAVFRNAINSSPSIESLREFSMDYDGRQRTIEVDFVAVSSEGVIEVSEVFP